MTATHAVAEARPVATFRYFCPAVQRDVTPLERLPVDKLPNGMLVEWWTCSACDEMGRTGAARDPQRPAPHVSLAGVGK